MAGPAHRVFLQSGLNFWFLSPERGQREVHRLPCLLVVSGGAGGLLGGGGTTPDRIVPSLPSSSKRPHGVAGDGRTMAVHRGGCLAGSGHGPPLSGHPPRPTPVPVTGRP
jgi:hypothetical protein